MRPSRTAPDRGGSVQPASSPMGKVSRWPLKMRRRPGDRPRRRASRLTMPGSGSKRRIWIRGTAAINPWATSATADVSPGGFGEAARPNACAPSLRRGRLRATHAAGAARTPMLLIGKASLPNADGHGQRPTYEEVDHGDKGEDLERPKGGGRQLHAPPGDLAHRDHRTERGELDELHKV